MFIKNLFYLVEATSRFELEIKELQSTALPLGYVALLNGDPSATRTRDTLIKSQVLLPTELMDHNIWGG